MPPMCNKRHSAPKHRAWIDVGPSNANVHDRVQCASDMWHVCLSVFQLTTRTIKRFNFPVASSARWPPHPPYQCWGVWEPSQNKLPLITSVRIFLICRVWCSNAQFGLLATLRWGCKGWLLLSRNWKIKPFYRAGWQIKAFDLRILLLFFPVVNLKKMDLDLPLFL